jgi:hypothetical protein
MPTASVAPCSTSSCTGTNQPGKVSTALSMLLPRNTSADCRSEHRKSVITSVGVSTCLVGISLERSVMTWDTAGVFNFIVSAEARGRRQEWGWHGLQYFVGRHIGELWMLDDWCRGCWVVFWDLRIFPILV